MKNRITSLLIMMILSACLTSTVSALSGSGFQPRRKTSETGNDEISKYRSGHYKVGTDIPEGEYVLFASGGLGYFSISSDSNEDNIIVNNNFQYNNIITVYAGDYLNLTRCYAIPLSEDPVVKTTGVGMFLVGTHIPSGEYKLAAGSEMGYYCIYSSSRLDHIVSNANFEGTRYVTVSDGQYLELERCKFTDPPEKPEKSYTDQDTVKKVQEALNTLGYDCGTPDGLMGSMTQGQIEKYQSDNALSVTGTITDTLLDSMGLVEDSSRTTESETVADSETSESKEIEAVTESETQDTSDLEKCTVSKDNLYPVFCDDDDVEISLSGCEYTQDASDVRITLSVNNGSDSLISVNFNDIKVDGVSLHMLHDSETYKVGQVGSNYYIMLENLMSAQCTDFDKITCVISGSKAAGEKLFEYNLEILREAFEPYTIY